MPVLATIIDRNTGEVLERLGPFETPHAARLACGATAGEVLTWTPVGRTWEAQTTDMAC